LLTEEYRGKIIRWVRDQVDFTYGIWNPNPKVLRYFEGHDWTNPQVLIEYLPANRNKFLSMNNLIGPATDNFQYHEFGFCQMENCVIRCYAGKHENDRALNGRLLAEHLAEKMRLDVLRNWDLILRTMGAALEDAEFMPLRDVSIFDQMKGTMSYIYELSFFIRTQFRWDDKPDDFIDEGPLMNGIGGINYPENKKEQYGIIYENKAYE